MCIFSAEVPAYARIRAGAAALKSHCASNIFLRGETLPKARHCCSVASEGTRPQGRGVPKYKKIPHLQTFPKKNVRARAFC